MQALQVLGGAWESNPRFLALCAAALATTYFKIPMSTLLRIQLLQYLESVQWFSPKGNVNGRWSDERRNCLVFINKLYKHLLSMTILLKYIKPLAKCKVATI